MDNLPSDPPPIRFSPPAHMTAPPAPPFSFANPHLNLHAHPNPTRPLSHPSYEDMIRRAISAMNEKDGSSRQKIAKYIETEYNLPQSSSVNSELTQELRKMKNFGQLVLVRHSYMLPHPAGPSVQAPPAQPYAGPSVQLPAAGPSVQIPAAGPSVQPYPDVPKRRPGRPPKFQPVVVSAAATQSSSHSQPVGFAAFSPMQSGVPTTNLFSGLPSAAPPTTSYLQFAAGPVHNGSTMGLVTGPVTTASPITVPVSGPLNGIPTNSLAGPVTSAPSSSPMGNALPTAQPINVPGPTSTALLTGPVSDVSPDPVGPVFDYDALANVAHSEHIDEYVEVEDSLMVETGPQSSTRPVIVSAAMEPAAALPNDGPLPAISAGPDSAAQNNDSGPSTGVAKRGPGRPPKDGVPKKVWTNPPALYIRKKGGRRGRPRKYGFPGSSMIPRPSCSAMSLRPRGRPRKNDVDPAVDQANAGGAGTSGVLPGANIPRELPNRSLGLPNMDLDPAGLSSEILMDAYVGVKARAGRQDLPDKVGMAQEMLLMAYEGLKARAERHFFLQQNRLKASLRTLKPHVSETAAALKALQDLEDMASMDVSSVLNGQSGGKVQGAPAEDIGAAVNGKDVSTGNIQSQPLTGESSQLTFQGTPAAAQIHVQEQQQEPPLQS